MAWDLATWLSLVRSVQILKALLASALHAFVLGYTTINRLGPASNTNALQTMMISSLVYSVAAFCLLRTGQRSKQTPWLVAAIGGDLVMIGILLAEITVLAQAGLPANCAGLWNSTNLPDDSDRAPLEGYTSIRFTNQVNAKGELDRYCALEKGFYIIALALVFSFVASIVVEVLLIVERNYTRNSQVSRQIFDALHEQDKARSKPDSLSSAAGGGGDQSTSPGGGGGIVDAMQDPASPTTSGDAAFRQQSIQRYARPPLPSMPRHDSSSSSSSNSSPHAIPSPMSPQSPIPVHHRYQRPYATMYSDPMPSSSSSAAATRAPIQTANFGYQTPEEEAAAAALITDGSRTGPDAGGCSGGLPPYPGRLRDYAPGGLNPMSGHADESNEIRLSDYVKGETRAQDIKDGLH